jgi:hypothetical protein
MTRYTHGRAEIINPAHPTDEEIVGSYRLWQMFIDPDGHDTLEAWEAMTVHARRAIMRACFTEEAR